MGCGDRDATRTVVAPRLLPLAWVLAIGLAMPLILAGAAALSWGPRDLFDVMASGARRSGLTFLRALPVVTAVGWASAGALACTLAARATGVRVRLCDRCAAAARWPFLATTMGSAALLAAFVAAMYLLPGPAFDERRGALLFFPWFVAAIALDRLGSRRAPRAEPVTANVVRVRGAARLDEVATRECPDAQVDVQPSRVRPPTPELVSWALPLLVVLALALVPRLEAPLPCPIGTFGLSYFSGAGRVIGCHAPDGSRHGPVQGAPGSWNSAPDAPGFRGTWWFDRPRESMTFLGPDGRERSRPDGL